MKTYHIKDLLKKELLIVEPPKSWGLIIGDEYLLIYDHEEKTFGKTYTFKGSYTLLGKPDEIREEDAAELVEPPIDKWGDDKFRFLDYRYDGYYDLLTAKESLLSLIESEIYWDVNPIKVHT